MKLKQSLLNLTTLQPNKGFTLVELTVTTLIASTVLALSLQLITDQRKQFRTDQLRSENNQTLRIGMDLIGAGIRTAGDNLQFNEELPVISVIDKDDTVNNPDTDGDILIFQRQLIRDTLRLCAPLNNGTTTLTVFKEPLDPACSPTSNKTNGFNAPVNAFRTYRIQADGNDTPDTTSAPSVPDCNEESVWAYIHDPVGKNGEFFRYAFETSDANGNYLHRCDSDQWRAGGYTYDSTNIKNNPIIYILEEQRFSLNGEVLELQQNRQNPPLRIANNIEELEIEVETDSGSSDSLNPNFMTADIPWSVLKENFKYLSVTLQAKDAAESDLLTRKDKYGNNPLEIKISSKFFPRNAGSTAK